MNGSKLTVLITNIALSGRSGTEIVTRNLALGLLSRGHPPIVYTNATGPVADELRRASIPVVTDIGRVGARVDVIHGHHTPMLATAAARYPDAPAIFLAHDFLAWFDSPPLFPSIRRYLAVDTTVASRLVAEHGFSPDAVQVILNAVDMRRFLPGPPLPEKPLRAIVFAKNHGHLEAIEAACAARGIALDSVGQALGRVIDEPERVLPSYDLVFASAMTALEAMACGRAVIVCDGRGLAGLVTPSEFDQWRPMNFGLRALSRPVDAGAVVAEIERYHSRDHELVARRVRQEAGLDAWIDFLVRLYRECIEEQAANPPTRDEVAVATAQHLQEWQPRMDGPWPWLAEREKLLERIDHLAHGVSAPKPGQDLGFAAGNDQRHYRLIRGFSEPETWGVWTEGPIAIMQIAMPRETEGDFMVRFQLIPFVHPVHPKLQVDIVANGQPLATWSFHSESSAGSPERVELLVPKHVVQKHGVLWLNFRIQNPGSSRECGLNADERLLGLGFVSMQLEPVQTEGRAH